MKACIEFFECKKALPLRALFDDFPDKTVTKNVKGDWTVSFRVSTRRGRSVKAKRFQEVTKIFDLQIAVWDVTLKAGKVRLQEKLLIKKANRQRKRNGCTF